MKHIHEELNRFSRCTGVRRMLGAILLAALLCHPGQVRGVVSPASYSVGLAWDRSSSAGVTGYRLYYGTRSGNYPNSIAVGNVTSNTVSGLSGGVTYFFAVTAVDAAGLESDYSSEISYVPSLPQLQIEVTLSRQVVLTVSGQIGRTYEVQAKSQSSTWIAIGTVTIGAGGSATFTDPSAANFPSRLYRATSEISYVPNLQAQLQIQITPSRQVVLTVSGLSGCAHEIQAKSLSGIWAAIGTVTLDTNGSATFIDPSAANFLSRMYRTLSLPQTAVASVVSRK